MSELFANCNEIYTNSATNNACRAAILGCGFEGVRTHHELANYAQAPSPASYSRSIITGQARWLAQNGLKMLMILAYGPPNNAAWRALGGDWASYQEPSMNWRAVRPPAGTNSAVWIAEANAYVDMIETARGEFESEDLDPAEYLQVAYMNEPRNVISGGGIVPDQAINDGSIDDAFHERAELQLPLIKASNADVFLWSPTVWRTTGGESAQLEPYVDHWAGNSAAKTSYASTFDGWCFNSYIDLRERYAIGLSDSISEHRRLILDICAKFRSRSELGMNTKPISCHEFGLAPNEGSVGEYGRRDNDYYLGKLRRAGCEAIRNLDCLSQACFYRVLDDSESESSLTSRYGFIASDGSARSSLIELARMGGNDYAIPPPGYTNAGGPWTVVPGESQPS